MLCENTRYFSPKLFPYFYMHKFYSLMLSHIPTHFLAEETKYLRKHY